MRVSCRRNFLPGKIPCSFPCYGKITKLPLRIPSVVNSKKGGGLADEEAMAFRSWALGDKAIK